MPTEVRRMIRLYKESYEGPAWSGSALKEYLEEFDPEYADLRIDDSYSPYELLLHIVQWREYLIEVLGGEDANERDENMPFPSVEESTEADWNQAMDKLDASQRNILAALEDFPEEKLREAVPGKNFTWYVLLQGVVTHDLYHLGQIVFIDKFAPGDDEDDEEDYEDQD